MSKLKKIFIVKKVFFHRQKLSGRFFTTEMDNKILPESSVKE